MSASTIALRYHVSTSIVINWLRFYHIPLRTHRISMNTLPLKRKLREQHLIHPNKRHSALTPEKAYILGVLAGDGHINSKFIRFEIRYDHEFIEEFLRCMHSVYGIRYSYYYYAPRNSYITYIPSQLICQDLLRYGDFRTYTWKIPKIIDSSHKKSILGSYLRGLYDSEGSVGRYDILFTSVSRHGAYGVKRLLTKLSIPSKIRPWRQRHRKKVYYTLRIGRKMYLKKFAILSNQFKSCLASSITGSINLGFSSDWVAQEPSPKQTSPSLHPQRLHTSFIIP